MDTIIASIIRGGYDTIVYILLFDVWILSLPTPNEHILVYYPTFIATPERNLKLSVKYGFRGKLTQNDIKQESNTASEAICLDLTNRNYTFENGLSTCITVVFDVLFC